MGGKRYMSNKMLLFLSKYQDKKDAELLDYQSDLSDVQIQGIQTSEAPTKYFLEYLRKNGENLDKILCIISKEVEDRGDFQRYEAMVKEYCKQNKIQSPEMLKFSYEDIGGKDVTKIPLVEKISKLYEDIVKEIEAGDKVYIDYTSGLRDISFLMVVLIRYMEFIGASCEKIIYSNLSEKRIYSINYVYDLFHVINGISEFMQNGSSVLLQKAFERKEKIQEQYPQVRELLEAMNEFSDMMALCIVDRNIDDVLKKLRIAIEKVQNMEKSIAAEDELAVRMLKNLLSQIQQKLLVDEKQNTFSYISIIRWCVENNMIQQAITFYIEKIPELYYKYELLDKIETESEPKLGQSEACQQFYEILYNKILPTEDEEFNKFKEILCETKGHTKSYVLSSQVLEDCEGKCTKAEWEKFKLAIKRMQEFLRVKQGSTPKLLSGQFCEKMRLEVNAKTPTGSWNSIVANDWRIKCFLENKFIEKENRKGKDTYEKKISALQELSKEPQAHQYGKIANQDLRELMEYYLILKVLRNQINHATETDEIQCVQEYLKEEHKGYTTEINIKNIKTILNQALDKLEGILPQQ